MPGREVLECRGSAIYVPRKMRGADCSHRILCNVFVCSCGMASLLVHTKGGFEVSLNLRSRPERATASSPGLPIERMKDHCKKKQTPRFWCSQRHWQKKPRIRGVEPRAGEILDIMRVTDVTATPYPILEMSMF